MEYISIDVSNLPSSTAPNFISLLKANKCSLQSNPTEPYTLMVGNTSRIVAPIVYYLRGAKANFKLIDSNPDLLGVVAYHYPKVNTLIQQYINQLNIPTLDALLIISNQ